MPVIALRRSLFLLVFAALLTACGSPTPSVAPSVPVTPSPSVTTSPGSPVPGGVSASVAAATALSADPRFVGFMPLNPAVAQQRWYELTANGSDWDVTLTVGWGDCSTACPHQHNWHYRVGPDGQATFLDEAGEGLPDGSFPSPASGVAEIHLVTTIPCNDVVNVAASCAVVEGLPGAHFKLTRFDADGISFPLNAGADGGAHASLPGGVYIMTVISRPDAGPLPAPFALSLAPGQDNVLTITFAAAASTPAPSSSATP